MPRYVASGIHERKAIHRVKGKPGSDTVKYRFLVMQRFGDDLQKKLQLVNSFDLKTTYTISKKVIDILEYIHSFGYIHADIKASNLLLGRSCAPTPKGKGLAETHGIHSEVWLVDFGLVEKFRNSEGQHRGEEEDQRRANNGTVEFTSRDAHIGALCRRSDLEILGFNMLSWLSGGRLPWMFNLKDHKYVHACKKFYMDNLHELFNYAFGSGDQVKPPPDPVAVHERLRTKEGLEEDEDKHKKKNKVVFDRKKLLVNVPAGLIEYFQYIRKLDFTQDPDYNLLKEILGRAIGEKRDDGRFCFDKLPSTVTAKITSKLKRSSLSSPEAGRRKAVESSTESDSDEEPVKIRNGLRARRAAAVEPSKGIKKKVSVIQPKIEVRGKARVPVRSQSVSPVKTPSRSVPTSSTTPRSNASPVSGSPFDKPTPAMLEIIRKLKEKQKLKNGVPSRLFADIEDVVVPPVSSPNGKKKGRKAIAPSSTTTESSPDKNIVPEKKKPGRPRKNPSPPLFSTNGVSSTEDSSPSPPKKSKGKRSTTPATSTSSPESIELLSETESPKRSKTSAASKSKPRGMKSTSTASLAEKLVSNGKKVSSNSSTHSTKENKGRQASSPIRPTTNRYPKRKS